MQLIPTSRREARTPRAPVLHEKRRRHSPRARLRARNLPQHCQREQGRSDRRVENEYLGGDVRLKVSGPVSARGLSGATDDRASLSTKGSAPAVSARSLRGRAQCSDERWPDEAQWRNAGGPRSPNQGELRMDRSVSRNTVHKAAARSQGWRLSRLRGECVAAGVQAPDRLVKQKSRATVEGDDRPFPSCCPTCRSSSRTAGL